MKITFYILLLSSFLFADIGPVPVLYPGSDTVRVSTTSALVSALAAAPKGRTILLSDGTYSLATVWPLRIRSEGVTLYGASRDPSKVILRGAGFTSSNRDEELIKIEAPGITLAYFTLRDGRGNGVKLQTGGNHNLTFHNVHFIDICERSIKGPEAAFSDFGIIRFCHFEQVTPITSAIPNLYENGDYIAGMDMMRIRNWSIHDNVFKNIRGMNGGGRAAVFIWNICSGILIERNLFVGCDRSIALGNPMNTVQGMDSGVIAHNKIIAGRGISLELCNSKGNRIEGNSIFSVDPEYSRTIQALNNGTNEFKGNLITGKINQGVGTVLDTAGNLFVTGSGIRGKIIPKEIQIVERDTIQIIKEIKGDSIPYPVIVEIKGDSIPYPVEVIKIDTLLAFPKNFRFQISE